MRIDLEGAVADALPRASVFRSVEEASSFFEKGAIGYSPARRAGRFDGLELRTLAWSVAPLAITRIASSLFDGRALFPEGTAAFDCALLMRDVAHEWQGREALVVEPGPAPERNPAAFVASPFPAG